MIWIGLNGLFGLIMPASLLMDLHWDVTLGRCLTIVHVESLSMSFIAKRTKVEVEHECPRNHEVLSKALSNCEGVFL